ncbi:glycosyltransferase family 2 protein [Arthrobacter sp. AB6]|uniref:glycosyltransferase family 2 protein n=1 Tax=Arthrobacter sp. AB6 TaxID=2962570 RepID=UPI002880C8AE|nr:glycosyltransferase family 2 protein [Arthrobacter sp. AB6]MDT0193768.1 glycosyltransferase family 2 protein [Arthrobacter sp. AB6]
MTFSGEASIIVPSRGGALRLPILLSALSRQDSDDFEVIVVVDGDIDNSAGVLRRLTVEHPAMALRTIVFPENRGRAAALNAGAAAAQGRVLIRSDDDLEPSPNYVRCHVSQHQGELAGVVGMCRNVFPETAYARVYGRAADERFRSDALATNHNDQWRYWAGNVSVLKEVHERLGGYDERYRAYGWEDVDFGYRLKKMGIPVRIHPSLTTAHHVAATTTGVRAIRALHSGAAREIFVAKHGPEPLAASPQGPSLWSTLVAMASAIATERTIKAGGSAIDVAAAVLPGRLAEKLVALVVESAGRAGIAHPHRARTHF